MPPPPFTTATSVAFHNLHGSDFFWKVSLFSMEGNFLVGVFLEGNVLPAAVILLTVEFFLGLFFVEAVSAFLVGEHFLGGIGMARKLGYQWTMNPNIQGRM